jgi:hypothetical protein
MGTPSGSDHIKLKDKLCPRTGQYFFLHTSYCLDYPSTSLQCHSQSVNITHRRDIREMCVQETGPPRPIHLPANISSRDINTHCYCSVEAYFHVGEWRMAAVLARECEGRHPMWRSFHRINMGWPPYRARAPQKSVYFWIARNVFMRRKWVLSTTRFNIMVFNMS